MWVAAQLILSLWQEFGLMLELLVGRPISVSWRD